MASVIRQPFAPLDNARLQSLTSIKNRQNAATPSVAGKRKADLLDIDNFENVDPILFTKRAKASDLKSPAKSLPKASNFILTTASPLPEILSLSSPAKPSSARRTLQPKSPFAKLNTVLPKSSPIAAPAGRSPTLGKRAGLLSNRRRTAGPYTRVEPPAFDLDSSAPFSLDAALKGTIGSYAPAPRRNKGKARQSLGLEVDSKAGWFFDIHEDTPEQEMTNLLQHGTCVLDISSDEESERKANRDRDGGCDKENVAPADDVSQTAVRSSRTIDASAMDSDRVALGALNAADFYAEGCDETSIIYVDEEDETEVEDNSILETFEFSPKLKHPSSLELESETLDALVSQPIERSSKAAVLQPLEGTEESFDLWESGSAKDETEVAV